MAISDAARFNPYHAKAGSSTGGQFSSSSGGGGSGKAPAKPPDGHSAPPPGGSHDAAQTPKQRLLAEAHADRERARKLETELRGLEHQHHAAAQAAKHHAAQAAAAKKAGKPVHHHHHAALHKHHHKHHATLRQRISHLRDEIHGLRQKADELEKQAHASRAAGAVTNPGGTERLHEYWVHGEGAAKIRWGEPGDFQRCVDHLGKFIKDPEGYCNLAHHAALGYYPATHAAMEHKAGRSQVSEPQYDADGLDGSWDGDCSDLPDLSGLQMHHFEAADDGPAEPAQRSKPKLGTGKRFAKLKSSLAAKGAHDPGALAAYIGRKKYGKGKFMALASKARGGAKRSDDQLPSGDAVYFRTYELEDIHIVRAAHGDATGRLVEAYAAVFNAPAEIRDFEGHYTEEIDPAAFNKVLADVGRSRAGLGKVKCMYNHGMTIHGTPSERGSMPIGTPVDIRPEARGLLTLTRYSETPFADEVLENIRNGSITAQSFTGRIVRSDPQLRRGDRHRPAGGRLPLVRRMELGLKEYGPTPFEAYSGAEIVGVRMSAPGTWAADDEEDEEDTPQALPPDGEAAPGEPHAEGEHSARYHQHALYALRSQEQREAIGLVW